MKTLTLQDFKWISVEGSFIKYLSMMLPDGKELTLEYCMNGFDVALYDENKNLIGEKVCTNTKSPLFTSGLEDFERASMDAIEKGLQIANEIYETNI